MQTFFEWFKVILILVVIIGGCGFISNFAWQAMGTTIQQIILGTLAIGIVWNCVVPFVGLAVLIVVVIGVAFLVDWLQYR